VKRTTRIEAHNIELVAHELGKLDTHTHNGGDATVTGAAGVE
jgi:hypothetical protein